MTVLEGFPSAPDRKDSNFGRARPPKDITGFGNRGSHGAACVEGGEGFSAELFEAWESVGASGTVAEESNDGKAILGNLGDTGGVAKLIVEGLGGTFGCSGLEEADLSLRNCSC